MLEIVVQTENRQRHVRVSAGELAGLVRRIGDDGDRFLVLQRVSDLPDVFAKVRHRVGGDYTLEYRDGAADRHFRAAADGPEAVIAAMTGWARQDTGWDAGPDWSLLDLAPAAEVPPLGLGEAEREELERRVREVLAGGYASRAELAEPGSFVWIGPDQGAGLVPCIARRRRASWRSHGNRRQRREARCQTP
ncbi:hypothetical protein ACIHAA_25100, partial [Streptomyces sp. NPDC052040]